MADTFTAILGMTLPEIGASDDTWGDKLNDNFDILDALFGTTGQGTVIVRDASDDALVSGVNLTKAAGNARLLKIKSGTSLRWDIGADATAEGGSNAGSLFKINRYDDVGALLGTPLQIARDTGLVTFASTPKVGSNDIIHQGNLSNIALPIGSPIPWVLDTLPTGWVWMNGDVASRASFPLLFAALGTKFGVGDGSTTFGLPDWREVVPIGNKNMGTRSGGSRGLISTLTIDTTGAVVGSETKTLATTNLPAYTPAGTITNGAITITSNAQLTVGGSVISNSSPGGSFQNTAATTTATQATSTFTGTAQGGASTPIVIVQPSIVCNWIMKAAA